MLLKPRKTLLLNFVLSVFIVFGRYVLNPNVRIWPIFRGLIFGGLIFGRRFVLANRGLIFGKLIFEGAYTRDFVVISNSREP